MQVTFVPRVRLIWAQIITNVQAVCKKMDYLQMKMENVLNVIQLVRLAQNKGHLIVYNVQQDIFQIKRYVKSVIKAKATTLLKIKHVKNVMITVQHVLQTEILNKVAQLAKELTNGCIKTTILLMITKCFVVNVKLMKDFLLIAMEFVKSVLKIVHSVNKQMVHQNVQNASLISILKGILMYANHVTLVLIITQKMELVANNVIKHALHALQEVQITVQLVLVDTLFIKKVGCV
ncbi:hypothetical protein TTHERM_001085463 (macronuclear) [Tetrahymena thermophila SB210]|uniref:Uncharacterized protein n=1 Tax=Tetrahymena thermophila (strain SB210) TaxID=312017 RepID=W7XH21_TETTS|nr:hypothetical protein TTHERM_001085463 [Tetrahymena thermophila SB210]EWS72299.1 hypothetical protein TTHERM_001085463 [Tetrahymena thermophila SB210]|eukprot:XP_012655159.1 hypothetical protein TTHERM_001085463 [Tetrahymena thermophila SB210]